MKMDKNALEYGKAQFAAQRFETVMRLVRHIFSIGGGLAAIWLIFDGLQKVLIGQSPDGIAAFAKIIEAMKIGSIAGYLWGGAMTAAWAVERTGKKRAIKQKSHYQQLAEKDDLHRSSSGLTSTGGTPDD